MKKTKLAGQGYYSDIPLITLLASPRMDVLSISYYNVHTII